MNDPDLSDYALGEYIKEMKTQISDLKMENEWLRNQNKLLRDVIYKVRAVFATITEITDGGCTATFEITRPEDNE